MANELITVQRLGELAATWAPDVPKELVAAVFEQESSWGTNPNMMIAQGAKGMKGPGQIQTAPGTYMAGKPESLFEGFFPSSQVGRKGNPGDPEDLAIAALRKMNADYAKGKGDPQAFSRNYFGAGYDAKLGITAGEYTGGLINKINAQKSNPKYADFITGYAGLRDPEIAPKLNLTTQAQQYKQAMPNMAAVSDNIAKVMSPTITTQDKMDAYQAIQSAMENVVSKSYEYAKAQQAVEEEKYTSSVLEAALNQQRVDAYGVDPLRAGSQARAAADLMKKQLDSAIAQQTNLQENLSNNPVYAMLDGWTQGAGSKVIRDQITAKLKSVDEISSRLQKLESHASTAIAIGQHTTSKISAAQNEAVKNELMAKTEKEIAVLRNNTNLKEIDLNRKFEDAQFRQQSQMALLQLKEAKMQADAAMQMAAIDKRVLEIAKYEQALQLGTDPNGKPLTEKQQFELNDKLRKEEYAKEQDQRLFKHSVRLGIPNETLLTEAKDDKRVDLMLTENPDKPSAASVQYLLEKGKLDPETANLARATYGRNSSPFYETGVGRIVDKKLKPEQEYMERNTAVANRAQELQYKIVNDGTQSSVDRNPYAANFWTLSTSNTTAYPVLSTPTVKAWQKTDLYKELAKTKVDGSGKLLAVSDADILETAAKLAKTNGNTMRWAQEVSLYFKSVVETNNIVHKFEKIGLPAQTGYKVPAVVSRSTIRDVMSAVGMEGNIVYGNSSTRHPFIGKDLEISDATALRGSGPGLTLEQRKQMTAPSLDLADPVIVNTEIIRKLVGL